MREGLNNVENASFACLYTQARPTDGQTERHELIRTSSILIHLLNHHLNYLLNYLLNYHLYYRLESTLNYGLERGWCIAVQKGSNNVALGYDEGSVLIKLGREEPAMSMDSSGKIVWAKHSEIQQVTIISVLP